MQDDFFKDEGQVNAFVNAISKARLSKYMTVANGVYCDALKLYLWKSQLSQSLYLGLQTWEILFRNKMNAFFIYKYGDKWPWSEQAERNFSHNDRRRLSECIDRLERDMSPSKPTTDQIVADLSAGFWVSQLGSNYQAQYGWKANIKFRIFTNDHSITLDDASAISDDLLDLRNRVAHHEPIFHLPLDEWRKDMIWLIEGMCPTTACYLIPDSGFAQLWANRPV
ncbi:hypothetical protein [Croceicoccus sp. BE223]|uniref:hypothetical protein n=1 Tax=Croceicoccus sp. BE223 TaxID=2817716 RepID=UPI002861AF64|nr:hypothetical protein [Croceicoccus sp. BE223]MDR7102818.1 hypothetical protein [Croceicoccus sp. BE223]